MKRRIFVILLLCMSVSMMQAQVSIAGSVYGGGNEGKVEGSTSVTVRAGDLNKVYGGARMADVEGHAFVNIDGEHASKYILINSVYGGNDISGNIGKSDDLPAELTAAAENGVDKEWNAFVRVSSSNTEDPSNQVGKVYLGQLFGGGNGYYRYSAETEGDETIHVLHDYLTGVEVLRTKNDIHNPELARTYLEIVGGSIVYAFGGGNNATVTDSTVIYVNNESPVVSSVKDGETELLTDQRIKLMGYNPGFTYPTSDAFQIGSLFGGNNQAEMQIQPKWSLQRGKIRNLYSGGNEGAMTCPYGLLLEIDPQGTDEEKSKLIIDNVYGGCRMADVRPMKDGLDMSSEKIQLPEPYKFPAGLSARVLVRGGDINNVYGGNDISSRVYGGNAVGVYTSIRGSVYGGGNGAYPYTDNPALQEDPTYGDLYYTIPDGKTSVEALNEFRPNAEQVSVRLFGTESKPTVIGGSVYAGGNCATLATVKSQPMVELKIGSYVYADNVYLGNNGEGMVQKHEADPDDEARFHDGVLRTYRKTLQEIDPERYPDDTTPFSTMDLTDPATFATYMDGVVMELMPRVVFDTKANGDPDDYEDYSSYFGSFFCGGNIGSMRSTGKTHIDFSHTIVIYDKVVGGSNNANVNADPEFNANYEGGLLGDPDTEENKLELTLTGLKIQPKRWKDPNDKSQGLIWNTVSASTGEPLPPITTGLDATTDAPYISQSEDHDRRLTGGNVYGGCYKSGHVNGNVIINLEETLFDRDVVFDVVELDTESGEPKLYGNDEYKITTRNSGVLLDMQGMDVLGAALNVFGGGYGKDSEIWGSTTINLNEGYTFQIFGGSEQGVIGKPDDGEGEGYTFNGKTFKYNPKYSCTVNVNGASEGVYRGHANDNSEMAEAEFIYGGGFIGPICGNTIINLNNGRVFNTFAGSCNADILGHTETYIGRNGFPYVRDYVYGGNDLGGKILGSENFQSRVRTTDNGGYDALGKVSNPSMLNASAYVEYVQGRVEKIYGGCYGVYDYTDSHYGDYFYAAGGEGTTEANLGTARPGYSKPWMDNAFVNFRPNGTNNALNSVQKIYGAGEGYSGEPEENKMQQRSYILVDIPQNMSTFHDSEFFGGGERGGVGMFVDPLLAKDPATAHKASAIIDLARGQIKAVYGGSYEEGMTRRTEVNVPAGSTIKLEKIFGGAYGTSNEHPCDVFESNVNWNSSDALVGDYRTGIYGGNNAYRRTLYSHVNINAPVYYDKENSYLATIYGAGYGQHTWAQYTEVNLNDGARMYEVYGGAQLGRVMNTKSAAAWKTETDTQAHDAWSADLERDTKPEPEPVSLALDNGYVDKGLNSDFATYKYNTNVRINKGASVCGYMYQGSLSGAYAYGGGLGNANIEKSGDVYGTTYIGLLGGSVTKDLYAAGTVGSVNNRYKVKDDFDEDFIATTNAYIEGGTARNVYGGGWQGSVGYHDGAIDASTIGDIPGETHVIIGKADADATDFFNGFPSIERNAYGGGEGGAVYGTSNITLVNGFIGYRHFESQPTDDLAYFKVGDDYYQEKLHDETWSGDGTNRLYDSGCIFGGGYIDNSSVDITNVKMLGGHVRNSLFGGGEIAAIGRGVINLSGVDNSVRNLKGIYKAGGTHVELFDGYVHRNVFGGGRGYNNLGEGGALYSDGYVFGHTEVHVHGGTVGTAQGVGNESGNVFGGGDIGYVYSAHEEDGKLYVGIKDGKRYNDKYEGYYYSYDMDGEPYEPASFVYDENDEKWVKVDDEFVLTEDCKVLVEPYCKATEDVTINGHSYSAGEYVPIDDLNTLGDRRSDSLWESLDSKGVIIYNAVFAGGNTSSGSSTVYANATTVFGNATASIHDVYNRDLITLGSFHVGGLYGDGNLTFVDGYRGLNITNYGTDFYSLNSEVTKAQYDLLPAREQSYYELCYKCKQECTDKEGKIYSVDATVSLDELITLFDDIKTSDGVTPMIENGLPNPEYWEENGVRSRYAGRPMNTIQRADFCGVWGSRMVMQGAPDRVPETVDYNNYTINRVREVSLNKKTDHGNYFGIYNIVNYLGALTSDFDFGDESGTLNPRTSDNANQATYGPEYDGQSFFDWKKKRIRERTRNNGNSHNKVALASGVYLELTSEESTGTGLYEKDWGYITGVIELDLINVHTGVGGGFVYAKNEHGKRVKTGLTHTTLTKLNDGAVSQKMFRYETSDSQKDEWQTSGNFVHSTQVIIDDCYNISGKYKGSEAVPAHYWYIKGQVYVYDQYISAYTGAPNAYSEQVDIPLTITAASHGTMKLLNIMPNRYAYYSVNNSTTKTKLTKDRSITINEVEYGLNTPISYWDWYLLTPSEQALFVEDTYYVKEDCWIGEIEYKAGTVMLSSEYKALRGDTPPTVIQKKDVDGEEKDVNVDFDFIFRSSNNLSHDTGYILTYKVNNPTDWNTWYTEVASTSHNKKSSAEYNKEDGYNAAPTYYLKDESGSILGQRSYAVGDVISNAVYDTYQTAKAGRESALPDGQATFDEAYIVTTQVIVPASGATPETRYNTGAVISKAEADSNTVFDGKAVPAFVCTRTIQLSPTEFIYINTKMSEAEKQAYLDANSENAELCEEINDHIVPAYYCTDDGLYGGNYYEPGKNYRALEAWASMSKADREHFAFNYDALDVLIDPNYSRDPSTGVLTHSEGQKYQYDSTAGTYAGAQNNPAGYSLEKPVDYTASYSEDEALTLVNNVIVKRGSATIQTNTIQQNDEISREAFETIPNERRHYSPVTVKDELTIYVVKKGFQVGNVPHAIGSTIGAETYNGLGTDEKENIEILQFDEGAKNSTFYFCRESYVIGEKGDGMSVASTSFVTSGATVGNYSDGATVPVGVVIDAANYSNLVNKQENFVIHGIAPTEVSTLYVSRESDIFNLSTEKIITVIYEYDYEETTAQGDVTPVSERHVVNIHIEFKSGVPLVEDIKRPQIVLPGTKLGMREPVVTPGAYEVTGGGWELFESIEDAESHVNGIEYLPNTDQLYWYQNGYYVAYYAKTYLGKTYSNHEPISVANYHDLTKVMEDKDSHYHIDNPNVKRNSKIYVTDWQNGAQQLKDLFDLSVHSKTEGVTGGKVSEGSLNGHALLNDLVSGCNNLDIIMHTDVTVPENTDWTPIANNDGECFEGTLHGDGYSIRGLNNSLFNHLCGSVYNLGVMGTFTGAGIAETGRGYVENCWVSTTNDQLKTSKPVFGTPTRGSGSQIVNCYYMENAGAANPYASHTGTYGKPMRMSKKDFYDGTVAYDLNGFYLYKRYNDGVGTASGTDYKYYTVNNDGTLSEPQAAHYRTADAANCSSGAENVYTYGGYVEDRYADGDFRYADGELPEREDARLYTDDEGRTYFYPIWPDDYLYFGQMLTFNWNDARPHEDVPSRLYKSGGRLVSNNQSNRVYRAPAYYQSKTMNVAHFNPAVNLAAYSKPKNQYDTNLNKAYPNMTAIDFKGHGDVEYKLGMNDTWFYQPLLDDDGLVSITNCDETPNLLIYAPSEEQNQKTYDVLTDYFVEPAYADYYQGGDYRQVSVAPTTSVLGHLVHSNLKATSDHLLVDKRDFNCPISYSFADGYRMWYQRLPERYVELNKGWDVVSLPFSAELVSTQTKGEITHFYSGSRSLDGGSTKIGHEYWLREYKGKISYSDGIYTAAFGYPTDAGVNKTVRNTFLWDYYYSKNSQSDANTDTYQTYYSEERALDDYPLVASGKPYILGLPGAKYYEFDLSGDWSAKNTASPAPDKLAKQTITFASDEGETIAVSDDELIAVEADEFSFMPNYMSKTIEGYLMDEGGDSFDVGSEAAVPFRPYFLQTASLGAKRFAVRTVLFDSNDTDSFSSDDKFDSKPEDELAEGELQFFAQGHSIVVKSTLRRAVDVRILNASGIHVADFTIQPGEKVEIPANVGVHIVTAEGGKYQKKLLVK